MQKARRHPSWGLRPLAGARFQGLFHSAVRGAFHLSLTVLCAIGLPGVLSLGGWCRRIRTGLLRPRPTQGTGQVGARFAYGAVTRSGPPFQARSATLASSFVPALLPRARLDARGLGCPPFARRYSGGHCCFPFLRLLGCFGSSGSPPHKGDAVPAHGGLPHSDTRGSRAARASPRSFAACRVLLRLREPRHPPYALARFSLFVSSRGALARPQVRSLLSFRFLFVSAFLPILSKNRAGHLRGPPWWRMWGSNPRPPACKAGALAN